MAIYPVIPVTQIEIISATVAQDYPLHPVFCPAPYILKLIINIIDLLSSILRTNSLVQPNGGLLLDLW